MGTADAPDAADAGGVVAAEGLACLPSQPDSSRDDTMTRAEADEIEVAGRGMGAA
ncbi:hypothetical protein GCM10009727_59950 [Actinomadura napierensis]|uniref:Uncharacterized protein n=1 Tax=Actinomadura napierensis TaxID=267854 RepID=A0ABN3A3Z4_9ACTN